MRARWGLGGIHYHRQHHFFVVTTVNIAFTTNFVTISVAKTNISMVATAIKHYHHYCFTVGTAINNGVVFTFIAQQKDKQGQAGAQPYQIESTKIQFNKSKDKSALEVLRRTQL